MPLTKPVSLIMTVEPVVATQFHNFSQVLRLFNEFPVHHLPIVDGNNRLIGIVSTNDIPRLINQLCKREEKLSLDFDTLDEVINISDIMTKNPISISPTTTIGDAAKIFAEKKFLALPVVSEGKLIGILSAKDVIKYIAE